MSLEDKYVMASIAYLERNDFTVIRHVSPHLLDAKDGKTKVYIWLDMERKRIDGRIAIPEELFRIAKIDHARIDIICMDIYGERAELRHVMNVAE